MKKIPFIVTSFLLLAIYVHITSCTKSGSQAYTTLYDKPLPFIQQHIDGAWKMEYEEGGNCSNCINDIFHNQNYIWEFTATNRIKQTYNDTVTTDGTFTWERDFDDWTNDSIYVMAPYDLMMYAIKNDTLIIRDALANDAGYYYLSKYKKP